MSDKHNVTLAYTGAGGTIVHRTLLKLLSGDDRVEHIKVVASPNGHKLLQFGLETPNAARWHGLRELDPAGERLKTALEEMPRATLFRSRATRRSD